MNAIAHEGLLEDPRITPGEIALRREAARLADIARNLESLNAFARAEAEASASEPAAGPVDLDTTEAAATGVARREDR